MNDIKDIVKAWSISIAIGSVGAVLYLNGAHMPGILQMLAYYVITIVISAFISSPYLIGISMLNHTFNPRFKDFMVIHACLSLITIVGINIILPSGIEFILFNLCLFLYLIVGTIALFKLNKRNSIKQVS